MRAYRKEDYQSIVDWCFVRDIACPPKWSIPESGIIIEDIAVGFLILTNNHCAILDFFISNPMSDKKDRNLALDKITTELIELAIDLDIKMITCNSQHPSIKERAIKHGFNSLGNFACFEKGL